jgi:hypothetical protein
MSECLMTSTSMSECLMTSDEAADALERWAVPQLAKRRRSRRTLGTDGKSPIAVPVEDLDTNPPDDLRPSDRAAPRRPPVVQTDTSDEAVRDARSLIVMLEARVAEMSGELKEARADLRQAQAVITDLTRKAARAEGLDALLAVEPGAHCRLSGRHGSLALAGRTARRHHRRTEIVAFVVAVAAERVMGLEGIVS